jgi:hypothetical protein
MGALRHPVGHEISMWPICLFMAVSWLSTRVTSDKAEGRAKPKPAPQAVRSGASAYFRLQRYSGRSYLWCC